MRAPILTSPQLEPFLNVFCAHPAKGDITLPVLNSAARAGGGVGFDIESTTTADTGSVREMCRRICDGTEALLGAADKPAVLKGAGSWELRWTDEYYALFTYRGRKPRFWNQVHFGKDTIILRRQAVDHSVEMGWYLADDFGGSGFNYQMDLRGLAVLSLKQFLGLRTNLSVDHARVRLYSQWRVPRKWLLRDVTRSDASESFREQGRQSLDRSEKEAWMDEASLFSAVILGGRLNAVEAYVRKAGGRTQEVVSVQDLLMEDDGFDSCMRTPLASHMAELWQFVANLRTSDIDKRVRVSYGSLVQDMYQIYRHGFEPLRPVVSPADLRESLRVYTSHGSNS